MARRICTLARPAKRLKRARPRAEAAAAAAEAMLDDRACREEGGRGSFCLLCLGISLCRDVVRFWKPWWCIYLLHVTYGFVPLHPPQHSVNRLRHADHHTVHRILQRSNPPLATQTTAIRR
jgi:hypothetical protein